MGIRATLAIPRAVRLALPPLAGAVLAGALLALAPVSASAQFESKAPQAVLMDAASGAVLYEKNADDLMHPASMSKLMTLAVVFRALREGRLTMQSEFTASEYAWRTGGGPSGTSAMFVPLNQSATLEEMLPAITVQSGNDASIMIAEGMSGSEEEFGRLMTRQAREIGLKRSNFVNSTGLTHPEHLTTARELAMLARHLIREYPEHYHLFALREYRYRKHVFHNRNPLVFANIGVDGLKTGYVAAAGFGIVASAERDGQRLIGVVNGLKSSKERTDEARALLEHGFRNFRSYTLFQKGETVGDAMVWGGTQRYVGLVGEEGVQILLPRAANGRLRARIVYQGPLKPPIRKGDQVAVLRVTSGDSGASNEVPLYAAEDIGHGSIWTRGFDSLIHLAFGWIL